MGIKVLEAFILLASFSWGGSAPEWRGGSFRLFRLGSPSEVRGHHPPTPHPPCNASCWLGALSWNSLGLLCFEICLLPEL